MAVHGHNLTECGFMNYSLYMATNTATTPKRGGDTASNSDVSTEAVEIPRHVLDARSAVERFNATHGDNVKAISEQLDDIFMTAWRELTKELYEEFHEEFNEGIRNQSWTAIYKAGQMASTARCIDALIAISSIVPPAYREISQELRDATTDYQMSRNGGIFEGVAEAMAEGDKARVKEICEAIHGWITRTTKSITFSKAMSEVGIEVGNKINSKGKNKNSGNSATPKSTFKKYQSLSTAEKKQFIKLLQDDETYIKVTTK